MALALIFFGVVTLVYRQEPHLVPQLILNWWPLVLILLGIEVLLAGYFCREEVPRIKYDFLALIFVFVIGVASLGLYVFNSSGFAARLIQALGAVSFTVDLPEKRVAVPEEVQKIIVQGAGGGWHNLQLRGGKSEGQLVYFGQALVTTSSEAEAKEFAHNAGLFSRQVGDTLFLELRGVPLSHGFGPSARVLVGTLILPAGLEVEVAGAENWVELEVIMEQMEAEWNISNSGSIRVTLDRGINAQIEAYSRAADLLQGNVEWEIKNGAAAPTHELANKPSEQELAVISYSQAEPEIMARATIGEGGPLLRLSSRDAIIINVR
ncbi:MAG: hypothetical protein GX039_03290 [Clostridia bacterium]|nr:hypothetical protein [Clostridia bacterium]